MRINEMSWRCFDACVVDLLGGAVYGLMVHGRVRAVGCWVVIQAPSILHRTHHPLTEQVQSLSPAQVRGWRQVSLVW